ncbi:MAG TPA: hypothetical protein VFN43_03395 [Humibacillus sp.]|nr:hypothetical protein [Humibacillus sp.]
MGLDTLAARDPEISLTAADDEAFRRARVLLCECEGDTSFRGKVYAELVQEVTGVSLFEEWIPPEVVRRMAAQLEQCDPVDTAGHRYDCTPFEVVELGRFFRLCADRGLGLVGSW